MAATINNLVKRLHAASVAYYETETPIMTDAQFDDLVEQLRLLAPDHVFFSEVGAKPEAGAVTLPVPMPSLDKRKPDSLKKTDLVAGPQVCSEKLDGISALWVSGVHQKPALYLRGNGTEGQDVIHCISGIKGLQPCSAPIVMVRGELIIPKGVIEGTLARNWVNGVLHQKTPSKEDLSKIHFVAYQVCRPASLTRSQQIVWLKNQGFEVAWSLRCDSLDIETLQELFTQRRNTSRQECDGVVIGHDAVPTLSAKNPSDAQAFKMAIDDQRATTKVIQVVWASSRTGLWIPRIQFEPVRIGGATIEFCTGFHAQFIQENGIGPGAVVVIRRSGDVIPTLEKVVSASPSGWSQPPAGSWKWDDKGVHALDTAEESSPEKLALELTHGLVTLGVEGISKITAKKLVDGGVKSLEAILKTPMPTLQALIGNTNGEKLSKGLPTAMKMAPEKLWIRAYLGWPKGFGETRIDALLGVEASVEKWLGLKTLPKGISVASFEEIKKCVPDYLKWRAQFAGMAPVAVAIAAPVRPVIAVAAKGNQVMSGFRDKDLQERLAAAGYILQDRIANSTNLLLVPDDAKETVKVKEAIAKGIRIVPRSQVDSLFGA